MRCETTARLCRHMTEQDGQNLITLQTTKELVAGISSGIADAVGTKSIINAGLAAKMAVDSYTKAKINHDGHNEQLMEAKWQLLQLLQEKERRVEEKAAVRRNAKRSNRQWAKRMREFTKSKSRPRAAPTLNWRKATPLRTACIQAATMAAACGTIGGQSSRIVCL